MPQYADHDRYFKKLLEVFFYEFLEAFFPKLHAVLDLSTKTFLSQELIPYIAEGDKKRADLIVETKLKRGDLLIIHVETQSYDQKNFAERMCLYYMSIYLKYRKPVFPIAVFGYDKDRHEPNTYRILASSYSAFIFRFNVIELHKLNWRTFMTSKNPVAAAMMPLMNYSREERVAVRLAFLRSLGRMELNEAKSNILYGFFEQYLKLDEQEEEIFMQKVEKLPKKEQDVMLEWPNSFYERGLKKGIEQGRKQGREEVREAIRAIAARLLRKKVSAEEIAEITGLSVDEIKSLRGK